MKHYLQKHYPLILSFMTPLVIMLAYFIYRGFYPFGNSTVLTVDLGQQYVDFFASFRHTLLNSPSELFYSFSKALGGPMLGEYAYYLLSPFNLLFLFFPGKYLLVGCLVIILLKYAFAGYTFGRLLKNDLKLSGFMIPTFATSYALMGWAIANQLNMLWLDAPIFLPLIISALYKLLHTKKSLPYILFLAAMILINYYMAYMICIFLVLFFAWYQTKYFSNKKNLFQQTYLFISRSLLAVGTTCILLLPTYFSLTASKGQYTQTDISVKFEYAPYKMLSKFVIGAFDFDQMPKGYPNLFIGSLALIGMVLYFISKKIELRSKIAAGIVSLFFFLSLFFEPLDLLWHGMQFPVWYPYRFSFIVSFWMLFLAASALKETNFCLKNHQTLICLVLLAGCLGYVYFACQSFSYITVPTILLSALFFVLTLLMLTTKKNPLHQKLILIALFGLTSLEMATNAVYSLNNLSYLTKDEFTVPTESLAADKEKLTSLDDSFYRIAQLYARTKGDGMAHDLNAGSYFSSALEKSIPDFYGQIGQPDGDNYVAYYNGTLISDSLLGMKYVLQAKTLGELASAPKNDTSLQQVGFRPDTKSYLLKGQTDKTWIYKNPYALSLGYSANKQLRKLKVLYDRPLTYQTEWLNAATGSNASTKYFYVANFNEVIFENTKKQTDLTGSFFKKTDLAKPAQIIFKFTPQSDDSYYLTLGSSLDSDSAEWYYGSQPYPYYKTFRHTVVLNPTFNGRSDEIVMSVKFKKSTLWLENFVLYRMDNALVKQKLNQLKQSTWKITKYNQRQLTGSINIKKNNQIFATTIPYSTGWQAFVDDKKVKTYKIQDTFVGFNITKGKHQVTLRFTPPGIYAGALITCLSLVLTAYIYFKEKSKLTK